MHRKWLSWYSETKSWLADLVGRIVDGVCWVNEAAQVRHSCNDGWAARGPRSRQRASPARDAEAGLTVAARNDIKCGQHRR